MTTSIPRKAEQDCLAESLNGYVPVTDARPLIKSKIVAFGCYQRREFH
jgi:hypothetical protein